MNVQEAEELVRARLAYFEGELARALAMPEGEDPALVKVYKTECAELVLLLHVSATAALRLEQLGNMRLYGTHGPKLSELGPDLVFVATKLPEIANPAPAPIAPQYTARGDASPHPGTVYEEINRLADELEGDLEELAANLGISRIANRLRAIAAEIGK